MKSDKEWLSIEPQICDRGRSMRILRKGFLTGLGLICVTAPLATAFAATEVTGINYAATPDGGVQITLATTGDTPEVSVFATEDPARIVLDLAEIQLAPVHIRQLQEEVPVGILLLPDGRLRGHVDCLEARLALVFYRAGLDAQHAAGAIFG